MTVGWIVDSLIDRFNENYPVPNPGKPPKKRHTCPYCKNSRVYETHYKLGAHIAEHHTLLKPILLIGNNEPNYKEKINLKLEPHMLSIANVTSANVNIDGKIWENISTGDLEKILSETTGGQCVIKLINSKKELPHITEREYQFSIHISSEEKLNEVDRIFYETIVSKKDLTLKSVRNFLEKVNELKINSEYSEGLGEYVSGIIIKERPESEKLSVTFSEHLNRYTSALKKLLKFKNRPLAKIIVSIIRFSINQFPVNFDKTGFNKLDLAVNLIRDPKSVKIGQYKKLFSEEGRPVCPMDHGTTQLLNLATRVCQEERWTRILEEECRNTAFSQTLGRKDKEKAFAIWGAGAVLKDQKSCAEEPLRKISAIYPFNEWVTPILESL